MTVRVQEHTAFLIAVAAVLIGALVSYSAETAAGAWRGVALGCGGIVFGALLYWGEVRRVRNLVARLLLLAASESV